MTKIVYLSDLIESVRKHRGLFMSWNSSTDDEWIKKGFIYNGFTYNIDADISNYVELALYTGNSLILTTSFFGNKIIKISDKQYILYEDSNSYKSNFYSLEFSDVNPEVW